MKIKLRVKRFFIFFIVFIGIQKSHLVNAQTVGPTAPEYTSFEPVKINNPIDIQSGDFTYQVPLMTIPGPEGGFPISLHYHAGIKPEQESSWVGLGWNLNVGAINRFVNLFPDDLNGEIDENFTYWEGGQTKVTKTALQFPQIIPYSAKIEDTFKGTKSYTVSRYHTSSNVNGYKNTNINYQQIAKDILLIGALSSGVDTEQILQQTVKSELNSAKQYVLRSLYEQYSADATTTDGPSSRSTSESALSQSETSNTYINKEKAIKRSVFGAIGFLSSIEKETTNRYWISDRSYTSQTGSLNRLIPDREDYFNVFDANTIPLLDKTKSYKTDDIGEIASLGGMFPSFDSYQVLSPSVGGYISPQIFENTNLIAGNFEDMVIYEEIDTLDKQQPEFRYVGDFSNFFTLKDQDYVLPYRNPDYESEYRSQLFDDSLKRLASGKHIEWFTNAEINDGSAAEKGFISFDAGSDREYLKYGSTVEQKIGGFMITDENGMTYHFSLPVYSYENFQRFEQIDPPQDKKMYKHSYMPAAYAYTWLLTGITGPNFHNTYYENLGTPGLDEMDKGYWVRFDYGLWTTQHKWRTPYEGFKEDIDGEFQYFSRGKKELYYLDKIVTRSHTALFVKEMRKDGKGISEPFLFKYEGRDGVEHITGEYNDKNAQYLKLNDGGFEGNTGVSWFENEQDFYIEGAFKPISTLRLKEIVLFENERLKNLLDDNSVTNRNLNAAGSQWNHTTNDPSAYSVFLDDQEVLSPENKQAIFEDLGLHIPENYHHADEIIDVNDFSSFKDEFYTASLKSVKLDADYSLMDGTPNSIDNDSLYVNYKGKYNRRRQLELSGKLTLRSLEQRGRGGIVDFPKMEFTYKNENLPFPEFSINGISHTKKDNWGYYHHLLNENIFAENKPLAQIQSQESAQYKEAWSLESISTNTGAKLTLDYESDFYSKDLVKTNINIPLKQLNKNPDSLFFNFSDSDDYQSYLKTEININGKYEASLTMNLAFEGFSFDAICEGGSPYNVPNNGVVPYFKFYDVPLEPNDYNIKSNGQLFITGSELKDKLQYFLGDSLARIGYTCNTDEYILCYPASGCPCSLIDGCKQILVTDIVMSHGSLNLKISDDWLLQNPQAGGDIRVKSFAITDEQDTTSQPILKTVYDYQEGLTSYSPQKMAYSSEYEVTIENTLPPKAFEKQEDAKEKFKLKSMGEGADIPAYGALLPSPRIGYKTVGVRMVNANNNSEFLKREQFTFTQPESNKRYAKDESSLANYSPNTIPVEGEEPTDTLEGDAGMIKFQNLNSTAGLLKKHEVFDNSGQLIFSKSNQYLHESVQDRYDYFYAYDSLIKARNVPGRIDQQYYTQRRVIHNPGEKEYMQMIVTKSEQYPSVLVKQETVDHLYNLRTLVEYDSFDILTGEVRKIISSNSYGETYLKESIPAYSFSSQSGLGSKFFDKSNVNLLSAKSKNLKFRVEKDSANSLNPKEVINASETIWSDEINGNVGIWQPMASYVWAPQEHDVSFEFENELSNEASTAKDWKKVQKTLKSDSHGRVLESEDINGLRSVSRISLDDKHVVLHAKNASYDEVAFSSAEYFETADEEENDGGVNRANDAVVTAGVAHTGNYSLGAGYLRGAFEYTLKKEAVKIGRTYRVSVWVYMPGFAENELENAVLRLESNDNVLQEVNPRNDRKSKEWYLVEAFVEANGSDDINISCSNEYTGEGRLIYFDDFRVQPIDASMNCFVYDQATDEMTHRFDNNHLYINYQYDKQGRLTKIYKEIFYTVDQLLSEQSINYKR